VEVPAGVAVVVEGAVADAFYVVVAGELDVSAIGERGAAPVRLRSLGPGTYFGEIGLIGRIPRTATVTATSECSLLRIDGQDFLEALTNLSASPSLLEGARTRLSLTHPSSTALVDAPQSPDTAATVAPEEDATSVS
jgi:CRP-like cAMP-binding protein